jgi:soluble lytic murein transglycosylase-like protein
MKTAAATCLAAAILVMAAPATADIWGFVDERGVAHIASYQVDERYYLFKKEFPEPAPVEPLAVVPDLGPAALNGRIDHAQRQRLAPLVGAIAKEHGLDAALLDAVITVESGYNVRARSPKGAIGLMQLMPETAERYAVKNIWDPLDNLRGGARYLRDLIAMFRADLPLVLAAYNAGEAAVAQAGNRVPPYPETRSYVPRVLAHYARYRVRQ